MINYYTLLNIDPNSDLTIIKKAFRKEIALYHPDKNKSPEAVEKFDNLVEAFDILSNKNKREAYDKMLNDSVNNKPVIIKEKEHQYKEWQKEAKSKSEKYKSSTLEDLLLLDLFFVSGDFIGDIIDDVSDVLGDVFDLF